MRWLRWLACRVAGHRPVRVITGLAFDAVSVPAGVDAMVTASHQECRRCGARLSQEVYRLGE